MYLHDALSLSYNPLIPFLDNDYPLEVLCVCTVILVSLNIPFTTNDNKREVDDGKRLCQVSLLKMKIK